VEQVDVFSLVGSRFQALGAATEKALSLSHTMRTMYNNSLFPFHLFSGVPDYMEAKQLADVMSRSELNPVNF